LATAAVYGRGAGIGEITHKSLQWCKVAATPIESELNRSAPLRHMQGGGIGSAVARGRGSRSNHSAGDMIMRIRALSRASEK
jgi:hypothetical protein